MTEQERIDDELLVLGSLQGDLGAFDALVGRWQKRLWQHAWRLTGNEEAAWDVMQESWIAISRGLPRLDDVGAFPAWAYRIVSHKCRDWIRREQRRRRATDQYRDRCVEQSEENLAEGSPDDGSLDDGSLDDITANLAEALARLPSRDRAILALRYQDEFSTAEIADILDIPAGTVKSRLFHARQRLRKYMPQ
jgi:RNA polymerase sigma factor (sigma-70 family)